MSWFLKLCLCVGTLLLASPTLAGGPLVAGVEGEIRPEYEEIRKGILDGLVDAGYIVGHNLRFQYQSAGRPEIIEPLASAVVEESPDVIVSIGPDMSAEVARKTTKIPVVFVGVDDPIGRKIIKTMRAHGQNRNVTGLASGAPVDQHLELLREMLPKATRIGVLYCLDDERSSGIAKELIRRASSFAFSVKAAAVETAAELQPAAQRLVGQVDVLYAPPDALIAEAIRPLMRIADQALVPVFAGDPGYMEAGAFAAFDVTHYEVGYQASEYVAEILNGRKPSRLAPEAVRAAELILNPHAALANGVTLTDGFIARASRVVN